MALTYRASPKDGCAWVTGASSGIGRAVALELARRGYTVAATARRLDDLEAVSREAKGSGRVIAHAGDVTDRDAMAALANAVEQAHGPIALCYANAGTYVPDDAGTLGGSGFHKTVEVNLFGALNTIAPVLAKMTERRKGQVAITSSVVGYGGLPRAAAYGATKAALINLAESLKFDCDQRGITLQIVNPGFVRTPLTDKNDFPMPFMVEADDAARRICDGFERGGFEITFPKRLSWPLKILNMLPYALYFRLVSMRTGL